MDFGWSFEQQSLYEELVRFADRELNDDVIARDADASFPHGAWKNCAAMGIQGLPVPAAWGGAGAEALTIMRAMDALAHAFRDNGLLFSRAQRRDVVVRDAAQDCVITRCDGASQWSSDARAGILGPLAERLLSTLTAYLRYARGGLSLQSTRIVRH